MLEKKQIVPPHEVEGYEPTGDYSDADDADRKVFAQLIELGANLTMPRHTIHLFYFPTEESAMQGATALDNLGYFVSLGETLDRPAEFNNYPVIAEHTDVINENIMRTLRGPFEEIAARYNGEYDGWEAASEDSKTA